jgi:hypothetical protein
LPSPRAEQRGARRSILHRQDGHHARVAVRAGRAADPSSRRGRRGGAPPGVRLPDPAAARRSRPAARCRIDLPVCAAHVQPPSACSVPLLSPSVPDPLRSAHRRPPAPWACDLPTQSRFAGQLDRRGPPAAPPCYQRIRPHPHPLPHTTTPPAGIISDRLRPRRRHRRHAGRASTAGELASAYRLRVRSPRPTHSRRGLAAGRTDAGRDALPQHRGPCFNRWYHRASRSVTLLRLGVLILLWPELG